MAEYLKLTPQPAAAKKLLLALIYLQEIEAESWPKILFDETGRCLGYEALPPQRQFAYVSHLHTLGFAPNSGGIRFLENPVKSLVGMQAFFDHLSITPGRHGYISWHFGSYPAALMSGMEIYALMSVEDIAHCSTDLDVPLITQIALRQSMRYPKFSLFKPDSNVDISLDVRNNLMANPRALKATLKRNLQKWATLKNYRLVAELKQDGGTPGITDVIIRISHSSALWTKRQLLMAHPRSVIIDVRP